MAGNGPDGDSPRPAEQAGRHSIASSADWRPSARSSVASSVGDETPRDRLMVLLEAVIRGDRVEASLAMEVREAVVTNALYVPHAVHSVLGGGNAAGGVHAGTGDPSTSPADRSLRSFDLLNDPFLRETIAPVASLTAERGAAEPQKRGSVLQLGRSDTITRDGTSPMLLRALSRSDEASGAVGQETLPVELQLRQMLHELPPHERHLLHELPLHVQAGVLAAGASGLESLPRLLELLQRIPFYDFDGFEFNSVAGGAPLSALFALLIVKLGLAEHFSIDLRVLARFTRAVEARMPQNGYHNAAHVADVVHSVAILLTGGLQDLVGLNDDSLCVVALLMAASIHDFEHPGLTGDHLVATAHSWALQHNDRAVLEQHHLSAAFRLLSTPGLDWTAGFSVQQRKVLRATVIDLVLGTEMKEHFKLLGEFGNVLNRARLAASTRRRHRRSSVAGVDQPAEPAPVVQAMLSDAERLLVLKIAMKVADLGHLRAPRDVHLRWVAGLCDEFYKQGDVELSLGMKVNELMSRERAAATPGALAESQVGFFDVIALPLVQHWAKATGARRWLERVNRNYEYWLSQRDAHSTEAFVAAHVRIAGLPAHLSIPEGSETISNSASSLKPPSGSNVPARRRVGDGRERRHSLNALPVCTDELTTTSGTDGEAAGGKPRRFSASECFADAAAGVLSSELLPAFDSSESSGARRRHAQYGSRTSSPPPGGSAGSDCAASGACAWCGLPPVPGVRQLSREARVAAATAAAAAAASAAYLLDEGRSDDEGRRRTRGGGARHRHARFSETDACRGLRATRVQFEEWRHTRAGGAAVAAVVAAALAPSRNDSGVATASAGIERLTLSDADDGTRRLRRSTVALDPPAHLLTRQRSGPAALSGQPLEDSAADASPPPPGDRQGRRSAAGSVKFEFDDAFSSGERSAAPDDSSTSQPGQFGGTNSDASWVESEERFGALVVSRSVSSGGAH